MELQVGDIVLFDSLDATRDKDKYKPALVLNVDHVEQELLISYMIPRMDNYVSNQNAVPVEKSDLSGSILESDTIVRVDKMIVVDQTRCKRVARLKPDKLDQILRKLAALVARNHYCVLHKKPSEYAPGDRVPYGGRVYNEKEMINLVDSAFDFWLTAGRYAERFEKEFAEFLGVKYCSLTNSGSSANLLAFMTLTSPRLGNRCIQKGDEVIAVAASFPTTVAPIIQYGAVPVFVDVSLPTYNIDGELLEAALSPKTKAVMLAHTLGNPFDLDRVLALCQKHKLWLIEDCCDALGSTYEIADSSLLLAPSKGEKTNPARSHRPTTISREPRPCGAFGHLATFSFYPSHHITMGEGGAVITSDTELKRIIESFRDWGRDCRCAPGKDNTCGRRFSQQLGQLLPGYDHKYVYSHFGYNLKVTEMQAAIGCAQLEKLPAFIQARKKNFKMLYEGLKSHEDQFILPEATPNSDPSWFGFLLTVRQNTGFTRDEIVRHLEEHNIQTRMLFSGNIIKHPCFDQMRKSGLGYRIVSQTSSRSVGRLTSRPPDFTYSALPNTDRIMRDSFWIGVYPGLTSNHIQYIIDCISQYVRKKI